MAEKFDPYYTWLGIPPEDQPPDHYRLLGVRRFENNPEVISNALDQRMVHIRSFQSGQRAAESQRLLNELSAAGGCLLNPEKKGAYDREQRQKDAPKLGRSQQFSKPAALHKSGPIAHATPGAANPLSSTPADSAPLPILPAAATGYPAPQGALPVPAVQAAAAGARFVGGPIPSASGPGVPAPHPQAPAAATPNMPVVVSKPAVGSSPKAASSAATWLPIVLLAGGGAALLMFGGLVLVGALYAAGAFSSKPDKNPKVAKNPKKEIVKPKEPDLVKPPPRENPPPKDPPRRDPEPSPRNPTPPIDIVALAPVVANVGQPLDLLKDFDRTKQVEQGKALKVGRTDLQTSGTGIDQFVFSVPGLPEEYMVETIVERLFDTGRGKDDGIVQGLVVGDRQCMVTVDGFNPKGMRTVLDQIDGHQAGADKDLCEQRGQFLDRRKDTTLKYYVFQDRLAVVCNDKTILNWTGGMDRLSLRPKFKTSNPKALFFGAWQGIYKLKKFEVRAIGADGAPTPPAIAAIPKTPIPDPPPETVKPAKPATPVVSSKFTLPDQADRDKARLEVLENFRTRKTSAAKSPEKIALADDILAIAKDEKTPATLYALLDEARALKIDAGDVEGAFKIVDRVVTNFDVDPWEERTAAIRLAAPKAVQIQARKDLADHAYKAALGAMTVAKFKIAEDAAEIAQAAAAKSGDTTVKQDATNLKIAAAAAQKQQPAADAAFDKLKALPDDADANETWGKYVCLIKRDWNEGVPYLVKASNATLKEAAALEASQPTATADFIALADKWWQAADAITDDKSREKDSLKLRAREWYERALPLATGLSQRRAQDKIDATAALFAKNSLATGGTARIPGSTPGTIGRLFLDKKDARIVVKYEPGGKIDHDDFLAEIGKYNKRGNAIHIDLSGKIRLPEKCDVLVNCPTSGGSIPTSNVKFAGKAGTRTKTDTYKFSLPKGENRFLWEIEGRKLGTYDLTITNADTGETLFVYYDKEIEKDARSFQPVGEITLGK